MDVKCQLLSYVFFRIFQMVMALFPPIVCGILLSSLPWINNNINKNAYSEKVKLKVLKQNEKIKVRAWEPLSKFFLLINNKYWNLIIMLYMSSFVKNIYGLHRCQYLLKLYLILARCCQNPYMRLSNYWIRKHIELVRWHCCF